MERLTTIRVESGKVDGARPQQSPRFGTREVLETPASVEAVAYPASTAGIVMLKPSAADHPPPPVPWNLPFHLACSGRKTLTTM